MARKLDFGTTILLLIVFLLVLLPLFWAIPESMGVGRAASDKGSLTLSAYQSFFAPHRFSIVLSSLKLALFSTLITAVAFLPILVWMRQIGYHKMLSVVELVMILPFLFSQALRLFSLRTLAGQPETMVSSIFPLLYTSEAITIGLAFSFSALFVLPVTQSLKGIPSSVLFAAQDVALPGHIIAYRIIIPSCTHGILIGVILMTITAWFSSLEYTILGKQSSILQMMSNLVAVQKYSEVIAFAMLPAIVCVIGLLVVVAIWTPTHTASSRR